MKILKITFKNLNSLKGEHQIDLENGLLGEAGIFSITGPTGAGKSTILDAITLALFGKAARYESKPNPGEMMTRGTGECAAEVLFKCNQGRYTAKWTLARARKSSEGKLQNSKREIAEAGSGKILAEKLREADQVVEDLTGLDYERFLRSVLLAQGRFKEFLDAGDNERGDLLEKITGTEIYSKISQQAYAIGSQKKAEITQAQQRLEGVLLKSEEELAALGNEKTEKAAAVLQIKTILDGHQKQIQRYNRSTQQRSTLEASQEELEQWEIKDREFAQSRNLLCRHEATQPLQAALIQLDRQISEHGTLERQIQSLIEDVRNKQSAAAITLAATTAFLQNAINRQTAEIDRRTVTKNETTQALATANSWIDTHATDRDLEVTLPKIRDLGEATRKQQAEQISQQSQLKKFQQELAQTETSLVNQNNELTAAEKTLTAAETSKQSATAAFTEAAQQQTISDWRKRVKTHSTREEQAHGLHALRQQWTKTQEHTRRHQASHPGLLKAKETANQAYSQQQTLTKKEKTILADKERIYRQSLLIAGLEEQRGQLKPDEACPLCGSEDHPYSQHLEVDESADQLEAQHQKQVLTHAQTAEAERLREFTQSESDLKHYQRQLDTWEQTRKQQITQFATAAQEADCNASIEDDAAFESWHLARQQQRVQTEIKVETLEHLDQQQIQAQESFKEQKSNHQLVQAQHAHLQQAKEKLQLTIRALATSIQESESTLQSQLASFNAQLGGHTEPAATPDGTRVCTGSLENKLQTYLDKIKERDSFSQHLKEIGHQLDRFAQSLSQLKEEHTRWLEKLENFKSPAESPASNTAQVSEQTSARQQACEDAMTVAQLARQSLLQKQADCAARTQVIETDTTTLNQQITTAAIESVDSVKALKAARLPPETLHQLKHEREELKRYQHTLQGQINQTQRELKKLEAETIPSDEEVVEIKKQHDHQSALHDGHNQRLGEITLLIEQDTAARANQAEQIKLIEELQKEARPWIELSALIGSASGDMFSKFAQGLTLAQLLRLANRHLLEINDRYQIQRTTESELGLQIIDRYQADAIRPTRSLSGGESFLVSLALALGLSDLAGNNTRIESLFIDEGFGTLDSETLDIALAALENLRMSNRTIGIISHVDALKQRISAQIQVSKANNGYGNLEIVHGT